MAGFLVAVFLGAIERDNERQGSDRNRLEIALRSVPPVLVPHRRFVGRQGHPVATHGPGGAIRDHLSQDHLVQAEPVRRLADEVGLTLALGAPLDVILERSEHNPYGAFVVCVHLGQQRTSQPN